MINITGLKDHEQSRLLQHKATIDSWLETLEVETAQFKANGEELPEARKHEIDHNIQNEQEKIKECINDIKNDDESPDEFIDRILLVIDKVKQSLFILPDDIEKVVRLVLEQFEKILKFAKEIL